MSDYLSTRMTAVIDIALIIQDCREEEYSASITADQILKMLVKKYKISFSEDCNVRSC